VRRFGAIPPEAPTSPIRKLFNDAGGRYAARGESYGGGPRFTSVAEEKARYIESLDRPVDVGETLDEIRELRSQSRINLRAPNKPDQNALGITQREIANALEARIDAYAQLRGKLGDPNAGQLLANLRAARTQLAKIQNVEDSMGAGGHVRASDFERMLDKKVPLSGELLTIAETSKHFGKAVQAVSEAGEQGAWSVVDYWLGGTGLITAHPQMALVSASRPLIRKAVVGQGGQEAMIRNLQKKPAVPPAVRERLRKILQSPYLKGTALAGAREAVTPVQPYLQGERPFQTDQNGVAR
jgi:hypothetical protein